MKLIAKDPLLIPKRNFCAITHGMVLLCEALAHHLPLGCLKPLFGRLLWGQQAQREPRWPLPVRAQPWSAERCWEPSQGPWHRLPPPLVFACPGRGWVENGEHHSAPGVAQVKVYLSRLKRKYNIKRKHKTQARLNLPRRHLPICSLKLCGIIYFFFFCMVT